MTDPRASHAPASYQLLCALDADVTSSLPADVAALARQRVAMTLGVVTWQAMAEDDPVADFAEQFVVDVTGVDVAPLVPRLGDALVPFVKAMWVIDLGLRTDVVLGRLFGIEVPSRLPHGGSAEPLSFDPFLRSVALLGNLDPLTTELVRLRVARHHNCRLCKSLRTRAAIQAGGNESLYDLVDQVDQVGDGDLDERQKIALRITEAIIIRPDSLSADTAARARGLFTDAQLVELVLDVMRNSANKVAVAFGADAPNVANGLQLYDIGPDGDMVMGEPITVG